MNIVIYARFSSHSQNEQSIEGQMKVCYDFAQKNNYNIVGEYVDRALSGTTDNRPEFKRMIEDSNKKYYQYVLVYQLDRFARNRYDSATYKAKLKKNGVRVLSARENISDDASGILVEGLLESMAEYYSAELSQKVKRGMNINAEKCLYNGGIIALGYKVGDNKKYIIDTETAPMVQKIFEKYDNGETVANICQYMNNQQIKTAKGSTFNKNSLRTMLVNKRYLGIYTYKGTEIKDGIPRIIEDDLFNRVGGKMQKNKQAPARSRAIEEYLLTTKLFCGNCKDMMTGTSGTSKTGKLHMYYTCSNSNHKINKCNKKNIRKEYIESLVIEEARKQLTDANIKKIAHEVVVLCEKEKNSTNLKRLEKLLKENEKGKANLFDSLRICDMDSVKKSIFVEIAKMDKQHADIDSQIALEKVQQVSLTEPEIKFFLSKLRNGNIDDIKYRKTIINVFVNSIYLYDDKLTVIFNLDEGLKVDLDLLAKVESNNEQYKSSCLDNSAPPI